MSESSAAPDTSILDATSTSLSELSRLTGRAIVRIDSWVEQDGRAGSSSPLHALQINTPFFVRTHKGRHDGRAFDFVVENLRRERWIAPQGLFRALFES